MPLAFGAGEALQFNWSENWAILGGERTKLQVAHYAEPQQSSPAAGLSIADPREALRRVGDSPRRHA